MVYMQDYLQRKLNQEEINFYQSFKTMEEIFLSNILNDDNWY